MLGIGVWMRVNKDSTFVPTSQPSRRVFSFVRDFRLYIWRLRKKIGEKSFLWRFAVRKVIKS